MDKVGTDASEYGLLTVPGAELRAVVSDVATEQPELRLAGNRAGILSLANVLLWLVANAYRREFLSFGDLGFFEVIMPLSLGIRLTDQAPTGTHGRIRRLDRDELLEWVVAEDELRQVALTVHRLACKPAHEYDRLAMAEGSEFGVHVRMTDAATWLASGVA